MRAVEREDWNRKHGEAGLHFGSEPNRFLVAEAEALPPGRALDVACGSGRNTVWLAERGWRVTGVDFSDVALENARRLAAERGVDVDWEQADLRDWVPPAGVFDLVAVLYLHLSVDERRAVHRRAAGSLAPGGTLVVVGHDLQNLNGGHGGPQDPRVLFTPADVVADLDGLEIEKAERVLRPVQTEEGEAQAIDALIRARR
jgi:2-polyprenyl-3-methyl-5-hydroxy-6-metoxy-1,4-benzoquinol methylase